MTSFQRFAQLLREGLLNPTVIQGDFVLRFQLRFSGTTRNTTTITNNTNHIYNSEKPHKHRPIQQLEYISVVSLSDQWILFNL